VKISATFSVVAALAALVLAGPGYFAEPSHAQQAAKPRSAPKTAQTTTTPAAPDTEAAAPPAPGWTTRCGSAGRTAPLECAMEQSGVLTKTGQLVVLVNVRVPNDTHVPVMLVQLPLGLDLAAGAKLQVDDGKTSDLQLQTCENRGCFASTQIAPDLLAALRAGKQLKLSFQNLSKETITIPLPLTDFAAAYDKIK
jgi:invasion protein IalB